MWALWRECRHPDGCDKLTSCPPNHFNFDGDNSNGCESVCMILEAKMGSRKSLKPFSGKGFERFSEKAEEVDENVEKKKWKLGPG